MVAILTKVILCNEYIVLSLIYILNVVAILCIYKLWFLWAVKIPFEKSCNKKRNQRKCCILIYVFSSTHCHFHNKYDVFPHIISMFIDWVLNIFWLYRGCWHQILANYPMQVFCFKHFILYVQLDGMDISYCISMSYNVPKIWNSTLLHFLFKKNQKATQFRFNYLKTIEIFSHEILNYILDKYM
jgi:hypothetical protein